MIDMESEDLLSLAEAAKILPGRPHVSTLWRWATPGVGPDRTRLETISIGGRRFTSRQALARFVLALSGRDGTSHRGHLAEREKAAADAQEQLDRKLRRGATAR